MALFQPAVKEKLKARVAIDGPTGSGKTWTALQWARILAGPTGPIGLVDTENRSAAYYAPAPGQAINRLQPWDPPYDFGHLPQSPPYDPRELANLLVAGAAEVGDDGVIVVDSLTHFWTGEGGTLDIVDHAAAKSGNSFTGWKEGTPAQRHLLDTIIHLPCHVIVTMRSKMEYVLEETVNSKGATVKAPKKLGMAPEQRAGVEYEFTVVADMDLNHRLVVSKSRCDLIADVVAEFGRSHEPAIAFRDWLDTGVLRITEAQREQVVTRIVTVPDADARATIRQEFQSRWGKTTELLAEDLPAIHEWLDGQLAASAPAVSERAAQFDDAMTAAEAQIADARRAQVGEPPADVPQDDPPAPDDPADGDPGPVDPQMELTP